MNDVNLNSSDLKLVRSSSQSPARVNASPQNGGNRVSGQVAPSSVDLKAESQSLKVSDYSGVDKAIDKGVELDGQLSNAVLQLNDYVQSISRDLQFEVDNELGQTVVKVVDKDTQKVIRQIPDEVALRLAEKLQQDEPLTLFHVKV